MKEYKIIIGIIVLAILSPIIFGLIISVLKGNRVKGVETVFSYGSKTTEVTYDNKTIKLEGTDRDSFLNVLKGFADYDDSELNSNIRYDLEIDFGNGHKGKISTEEKAFVYDNHDYGKIIMQKDVNSIMEIINKNIIK